MECIKDEIYWVIKGQILGVRKPSNQEEVRALMELGVVGIISLLDDTENHDLYKEVGIDFLWLPVKGGSVPDHKQVEDAHAFALKIWENSKSLAIHCSGGKKRTATLIASILIKNNKSLEETLSMINKANPYVKLSEGQLQFIHQLAKES